LRRWTGEGNGPATVGISPSSVNLQWLVRKPTARDGYLMSLISEAGSALATAMPAYKNALGLSER
jgi:hypothetical protein